MPHDENLYGQVWERGQYTAAVEWARDELKLAQGECIALNEARARAYASQYLSLKPGKRFAATAHLEEYDTKFQCSVRRVVDLEAIIFGLDLMAERTQLSVPAERPESESTIHSRRN